MTTLYIHAPAMDHDWPHHPENAKRGAAVLKRLQEDGIYNDLLVVEPKATTGFAARQIHDAGMLERSEVIALQGGGLIDADTYCTEQSYQLALIAAGAACQAVDLIATGEADNGFVFARPPGHHAEARRAMGFCLINNIALAARHAQRNHQLKKILIVDFDVHHGNGTEDIFYDDPSVYFVSSHQYGFSFYPGSGGLRDVGQGAGKNFNLNIPFFPDVGDEGYMQAYREIVIPKAREFQPDMILVSAGYDAHWMDPLASIQLTLTGYAKLSALLVDLAAELCDGKILFLQEGGYMLDALAYGVQNSIYALKGIKKIEDPLGANTLPEPDVTNLLTQIKQQHLMK